MWLKIKKVASKKLSQVCAKHTTQKNKKGRFLGMLFGTLAASKLRSALTGRGLIGAGERTIKAGENF